MRAVTYYRNNGNPLGLQLIAFIDDEVVFALLPDGVIRKSFSIKREYFDRASHFSKVEL